MSDENLLHNLKPSEEVAVPQPFQMVSGTFLDPRCWSEHSRITIQRRLQMREEQGSFRIGKAVVDPARATVSIGKTVLPLQAIELRLLEFLFEHPEKCFTREELLNLVWGHHSNGLVTRTVDQTVARVRHKIGDKGPEHKNLKTVRGSGYCLCLV